MRTTVLLLNSGEPEEASLEDVVAFPRDCRLIGGSPVNAQARAQALQLAPALERAEQSETLVEPRLPCRRDVAVYA